MAQIDDPLNSEILFECSLADLLLLSLIYDQVVDNPVVIYRLMWGGERAVLLVGPELLAPLLVNVIVEEEHLGSLHWGGDTSTHLLNEKANFHEVLAFSLARVGFRLIFSFGLVR